MTSKQNLYHYKCKACDKIFEKSHIFYHTIHCSICTYRNTYKETELQTEFVVKPVINELDETVVNQTHPYSELIKSIDVDKQKVEQSDIIESVHSKFEQQSPPNPHGIKWRDDKITWNQSWKLYYLGYRGPDITTKGEASDLISEFSNEKNPLLKQVKKLRNQGYKGSIPTEREECNNFINNQQIKFLLPKLKELGHDGPIPENSEEIIELIFFLNKLKELEKLGYDGPKPENSEKAMKIIHAEELKRDIRLNEEYKKQRNEKMDKNRDFTSF